MNLVGFTIETCRVIFNRLKKIVKLAGFTIETCRVIFNKLKKKM